MAGEPRIRVSAILRWHGRILLARHEKPGKEYWLLPGGGVNSGESLVDALHRELAEVIGIDDRHSVEGPVAIVDSIAPTQTFAAKSEPLKEAVLGGGAALLAVCGGYQLLGRGYRGFHGEDMPGVGLLPLETVAGERRMIGDVLLETDLDGATRTIAGFENHAGRTHLDPDAEPLGRVLAGFGNDGKSGFEGCRLARAVGIDVQVVGIEMCDADLHAARSQ